MNEKKLDRPFTYEECSECDLIQWALAENERGFCTGCVKNPSPKEDVLRFCLIDRKESKVFDLAIDEAFTIASVLITAGCDYLKKVGLMK